MNELNNPYYRLQKFFSVIEEMKISANYDDELHFPLKIIRENIGIPIEIFRSDISFLLEIANLQFTLVYGEENISERYIIDGICSWMRFREDIIAGKYDDADLEVLEVDDRVYLPLDKEEEEVIKQVLHIDDINRNDKASPFLIKDSYHFNFVDENRINNTLYEIKSAIDRRKVLKIRYREDNTSFFVSPVRLFYDATENIYAVLAYDEGKIKAYRIDKIDKLQETQDRFEWPENIDKLLSIIPNVWGLEFDEPPIKVKVRIYANHSNGNVGKKVMRDLERRTNKKLYQDGECLIYEDKVYGKEAFLRWVFSYGSSMVVEKPETLREYIVDILENELI